MASYLLESLNDLVDRIFEEVPLKDDKDSVSLTPNKVYSITYTDKSGKEAARKIKVTKVDDEKGHVYAKDLAIDKAVLFDKSKIKDISLIKENRGNLDDYDEAEDRRLGTGACVFVDPKTKKRISKKAASKGDCESQAKEVGQKVFRFA